jgi:hypothetical protein
MGITGPTQNRRTRTILGQESWTIRTSDVEASITRQGGHLAPLRFRLGKRWIEPFAIAPWAKETLAPATPQVLRVMRGEFFCMPFGANEKLYKDERHSPHGETANNKWTLESIAPRDIHLSMSTSIRKGRVDKHIKLAPAQKAVYLQHVISGMKGRMPIGHHPILRVPDNAIARVSVSAFRFGQTFPGTLEDPARGGYSSLKPGARFTSLHRIPRNDGSWLDLSTYPAREGYEDLVIIASDPSLAFAWTAFAVPEKNYVWFSLKDPRVLPSTIVWMSNGGRHYPPWNGRHRRVIGLEEVSANFHYGLAESSRSNPLNRAGVPTCIKLDPRRPLAINYIMAAARTPGGFDVVKSIDASRDSQSIRITSESGRTISMSLDVSFLGAQPIRFNGH